MNLIEIGQQVRAQRREQGMSQQELATKAGIGRARLNALENGRIAEIGFKHLTRLLYALGLELRLGDLDRKRPTLDDLEKEAADDPRLDR